MSRDNNLLTARELAETLKLSVETVWRYTRQGRIPFVELGNKQYRYNLAAVVAALAKGPGTVHEEAPSYGKKYAYTYGDYLQLPEEPGVRFEVLEGELIKEPSPTVLHQHVSSHLYRILAEFFASIDPEGVIYYAPLDVTLSEYTVVQPDLMYIPGDRLGILKETRVDGPPELVVEILPPTNQRKDRIRKMEIYRKAGIPHYWIVDPKECTLEAFALCEGKYMLSAAASEDETFTHPAFPGLAICLQGACRLPGS